MLSWRLVSFGESIMTSITPFDEIDRMFDRMTRGFDGSPGRGARTTPIDLAEYDDELVIVVDLPGFDSEDIDVTLEGDRLTIAAIQEDEIDESNGAYIHRERRSSSVRRTVTLPVEVQEDTASATYTNGVLTVTLPKVTEGESDSAHHIDVN